MARGGLKIHRDCSLQECPLPDVLLIPGGVGINQLLDNQAIIEWVRSQAAESRLVASVCTGAVLLGRCGLLDGIGATAHHCCIDQLRNVAPKCCVLADQRFVDTGRVVTSAGISAGIDMSLHLVRRLISPERSRAVALRMEYEGNFQGDAIAAHRNELGQPIGAPMPTSWAKRPFPPRSPMTGRYCRAEPLDPKAHAAPLWDAFASDVDGKDWTYLPYGPFTSRDELERWLTDDCMHDDPQYYTIIDSFTDSPVGLASYLRIQPELGVVEVGHIHYAPRLQRTTAATEAMYLMMSRVFDELGYRRYEWKCDALNQQSCDAARRLGFTYEGTFRQATIYKGRNRDTTWFSITDRDWPQLKGAYERWLNPQNHDEQRQQRQRLTELVQEYAKP